MRPRQFAIVAAAALSPLLLAGCLTLRRQFPEKRYYLLEVSRRGEAPPPSAGAVLEIRRFRVSPPYDRKGFVYRRENARIESDFYNEFFVEPDSLLTEQTRLWIAESGLFANVVDSSSNAEAGYVLEGRANALYADYSRASTPKAVLRIQFFLSKERGGESSIVFHKDYAREIPAKGDAPHALVLGWDEALGQILTELENDLRGLHLESR